MGISESAFVRLIPAEKTDSHNRGPVFLFWDEIFSTCFSLKICPECWK
jgi:hypothetical protein